jgi:16S rRNA (guanine527-N7)-methyltransferase
MHDNLNLNRGIEAMGLALTDDQTQSLIQFLNVLQQWNRVTNLTAIRDWDQMITHHLLDSLAVAPFITGKRILDLGTGAGLPGIPLAVYYPEKKFVLLDSNGKKIRFVNHVKATLGLKNVETAQERMENFSSSEAFDVIICRALGSLDAVMQASAPLLAPEGCWLFMKGTYPQNELAAIDHPVTVHALTVPGLSAERHVVQVSHKGETGGKSHCNHQSKGRSG